MQSGGWLTTTAVVAVTAVALGAGTAAATDRGTPTSPHPRTFAVGVQTEAFVDASRPTPANGTYPGSPSRPLPTLVLYPARGPAGGPDRPGATPATGPFPLLVFSHGIDSNGADYEPLLRQWAAAGYVVAAPTFPLSNHDAPGGDTVADYRHQSGDVSYVITAMLRQAHDRASRFRGLINPGRIAAVGHSLGASTTLGVAVNSCCVDPRIRAAVSLEGIELPFGTGTYFEGRTPPLLLFHGDADKTVPYAASQRLFADAPAPKFFVTLHGAPHTAFRQADTATKPPTPWEPVIVSSVLDFFARYLDHQPTGLVRLQADANIAGVASLQAQPLTGPAPSTP